MLNVVPLPTAFLSLKYNSLAADRPFQAVGKKWFIDSHGVRFDLSTKTLEYADGSKVAYQQSGMSFTPIDDRMPQLAFP